MPNPSSSNENHEDNNMSHYGTISSSNPKVVTVSQGSFQGLTEKSDENRIGDSRKRVRLFGVWIESDDSSKRELGMGFVDTGLCQNHERGNTRGGEGLLGLQPSCITLKKSVLDPKPNENRKCLCGLKPTNDFPWRTTLVEAQKTVSWLKLGFSHGGSSPKDAPPVLNNLKNSARDASTGDSCNKKSPFMDEARKGYQVKPTSRKRKRSNEPMIYEKEEQYNEVVPSKLKRIRSFARKVTVSPPDQNSSLPIEFKDCLRSLNEGSTIQDEVLVIQKVLSASDVSSQQNRFSIPLSQLVNDFLNDDEKLHLHLRSENGKNVSKLDVNLIDPLRKRWIVKLRRWEMKKENSTKNSELHVITGPWTKIVLQNELKEGDIVQLWAVRVNGYLWFALVKLSNATLLNIREGALP